MNILSHKCCEHCDNVNAHAPHTAGCPPKFIVTKIGDEKPVVESYEKPVCDCKTDVDQECYQDHSPATEGEKHWDEHDNCLACKKPMRDHWQGCPSPATEEKCVFCKGIGCEKCDIARFADTEGDWEEEFDNYVPWLPQGHNLNLQDVKKMDAELKDFIRKVVKSAEERAYRLNHTEGHCAKAMMEVQEDCKRALSQREDEIWREATEIWDGLDPADSGYLLDLQKIIYEHPHQQQRKLKNNKNT